MPFVVYDILHQYDYDIPKIETRRATAYDEREFKLSKRKHCVPRELSFERGRRAES